MLVIMLVSMQWTVVDLSTMGIINQHMKEFKSVPVCQIR